jgi:predicted nucleotidyltransferase
MNKSDVMTALNGYKIANKFIEKERRTWLQNLTSSQSLKIYLDLCRLYEKTNTVRKLTRELELKKIPSYTKQMIKSLESIWEICNFLTDHKIKYVIIGGMALQHWGEPRFTRDVDITISIIPEKTDETISLLTNNFKSRVANPVEFAGRTRMVLLETKSKYSIDISLAIPGYEDDVMNRAVDYKLLPGKYVKMCSAEDLIIHKSVAGRPQDIKDVESVVIKQAVSLDVKYIRTYLKQFSSMLENPELSKPFDHAWSKLKPK